MVGPPKDNKNDESSLDVLKELENIDDECDQKGVIFVKIDNPDEAKEYGIDSVPSLIYFENSIPSLFVGNWQALDASAFTQPIHSIWTTCWGRCWIFLSMWVWCQTGDLKNEESVLDWLSHQLSSDEIEDVTDEMLDMLVTKMPSLAALFCKLEVGSWKLEALCSFDGLKFTFVASLQTTRPTRSTRTSSRSWRTSTTSATSTTSPSSRSATWLRPRSMGSITCLPSFTSKTAFPASMKVSVTILIDIERNPRSDYATITISIVRNLLLAGSIASGRCGQTGARRHLSDKTRTVSNTKDDQQKDWEMCWLDWRIGDVFLRFWTLSVCERWWIESIWINRLNGFKVTWARRRRSSIGWLNKNPATRLKNWRTSWWIPSSKTTNTSSSSSVIIIRNGRILIGVTTFILIQVASAGKEMRAARFWTV